MAFREQGPGNGDGAGFKRGLWNGYGVGLKQATGEDGEREGQGDEKSVGF